MMASSPLFKPRMSSPRTDNLLSWLRPWVVKGSEKEDEGGDKKGGGNGREGRLAHSAYPVSKRKGEARGMWRSGMGVVMP